MALIDVLDHPQCRKRQKLSGALFCVAIPVGFGTFLRHIKEGSVRGRKIAPIDPSRMAWKRGINKLHAVKEKDARPISSTSLICASFFDGRTTKRGFESAWLIRKILQSNYFEAKLTGQNPSIAKQVAWNCRIVFIAPKHPAPVSWGDDTPWQELHARKVVIADGLSWLLRLCYDDNICLSMGHANYMPSAVAIVEVRQ